MAWDDAKIGRFARAWNAGLPAEQVAVCFGMTADAVRQRLSRMRDQGYDLRPGEHQAAVLANRRERARRRLQIGERKAPPETPPPPSRFHNLADAELADALGRLDAAARATEADLASLKQEFKARGLLSARGETHVVELQERICRRLDIQRVRLHFGAQVAAFETAALVAAVVIRPVDATPAAEPAEEIES